MADLLAADAKTLRTLAEISRRYGTPTYAYDAQKLRAQADKLRTHLPAEVEILYSLKANASLGICNILAECGIGADVASAGEMAIASAAGFRPSLIFVAGPFKAPETVTMLHDTPEAMVSVDSLSELHWLASSGMPNPMVLRLRPDFGSCAVVKAGSESRFGFTCEDLEQCRAYLADSNLPVVGFHVFAGSQVLDSEELCTHLRRALDLSLRAAETLGISPQLINLGGGFGIPYGPQDAQLDLSRVAREFDDIVARAAGARIVLELGRFLVAEAGWYLTTVLGKQRFQGRHAVVVDGGVHQRADMCGLCLRSNSNPPLVLGNSSGPLTSTDVLGCLSLPDDVMIEASPLPELNAGDVLAFQNAGAYGLWSSPALFHASPLPAEVAFDGSTLHLMRQRRPPESVLDDQHQIVQETDDAPA